ncbi:crosslink repair DNA glycosylase YcaQ family protein [Microlunatus panaciterrae]|uniref:Winged helix DNA-binding domain-containing protein n=1 Tax=Microlunatus panaciterrae TaxID=400768 RepID=A0ABS2RIC8_9ACTN|nr:crosslink repair DNA glycosylase YcaQ family protein [Microlunatus panaciterrae]MBM7798473.1 hypothetical protein [Microlunatus panaciterrae]
MAVLKVSRAALLRYRLHAQQLDRALDPVREITDASVLDLGVQFSGNESASWSLVSRGVSVPTPAALNSAPGVALAWTLRGAPHFYRRADLADVQVATSPFSEADAGKRIYDANRPLKAAGIPALAALTAVAAEMRALVRQPMGKGELSSRLAEIMPAEYLRFCRPCNATHLYEMPFRLAALHAGLELEPGTSPPVLRRIPGWPKRQVGPATDPLVAATHIQPIRAYLRLFGPATPQQVAAFLDAPVADIRRHWPADTVDILLDTRSSTSSALVESLPLLTAPPGDDQGQVRLLNGYDLFMQCRDRELLVPDPARHKELWPVLGRPGVMLLGAEVIGSWRPKASGSRFTLRVTHWTRPTREVLAALEGQAELLARHRGQRFDGLVDG